MDRHSFRDLLMFSIGLVVEPNRALLRRILKEHVSDDAREQFARRVVARGTIFHIAEPDSTGQAC